MAAEAALSALREVGGWGWRRGRVGCRIPNSGHGRCWGYGGAPWDSGFGGKPQGRGGLGRPRSPGAHHATWHPPCLVPAHQRCPLTTATYSRAQPWAQALLSHPHGRPPEPHPPIPYISDPPPHLVARVKPAQGKSLATARQVGSEMYQSQLEATAVERRQQRISQLQQQAMKQAQLQHLQQHQQLLQPPMQPPATAGSAGSGATAALTQRNLGRMSQQQHMEGEGEGGKEGEFGAGTGGRQHHTIHATPRGLHDTGGSGSSRATALTAGGGGGADQQSIAPRVSGIWKRYLSVELCWRCGCMMCRGRV